MPISRRRRRAGQYGSPITGMSRGARAARAKNRICPSQGGRRRAAQYRRSPMGRSGCRAARAKTGSATSQGGYAARAGNTRARHNRDVALERAQKPDLPISRRRRRARAIPGSPVTGMSRGARARAENQICPSQGGRRRARAIPGSPITGCRAARARRAQNRICPCRARLYLVRP